MGAASAAHQVEGAWDEDGKDAGIWDSLYGGHVKRNENGKIACDYYHRYKEDIALMKQMGLIPIVFQSVGRGLCQNQVR